MIGIGQLSIFSLLIAIKYLFERHYISYIDQLWWENGKINNCFKLIDVSHKLSLSNNKTLIVSLTTQENCEEQRGAGQRGAD